MSSSKNTTTNKINPMELSGTLAKEKKISSVASPKPQMVAIDFDSNAPTICHGYGRQKPIIPRSLNDLGLPANFFNNLETVLVVLPWADLQKTAQSASIWWWPRNFSSISTKSIATSTVNIWEKSSDMGPFYSYEPQTNSLASRPSLPPRLNR